LPIPQAGRPPAACPLVPPPSRNPRFQRRKEHMENLTLAHRRLARMPRRHERAGIRYAHVRDRVS
ncbi:hypothetical protein FRC00_013673, partial [Tulasnella sp. 408]